MTHIDSWLAEQDLMPADLTADRLQAFLRGRRRTDWGVGPLLRYPRTLGVVPPPATPIPRTPVDHLMERYREHLVRERGLVITTADYYEVGARVFLDELASPAGLDLAGLLAHHVTSFVVRQCSGNRAGRAKVLVKTLRSLLRFLFLEGLTPLELAPAVPAVAGWRGAALPKAIAREQVVALLRSCDREHPLGRRDYAVLTLLARLGLRAVEVGALKLTDIDWRGGGDRHPWQRPAGRTATHAGRRW